MNFFFQTGLGRLRSLNRLPEPRIFLIQSALINGIRGSIKEFCPDLPIGLRTTGQPFLINSGIKCMQIHELIVYAGRNPPDLLRQLLDRRTNRL